MAVLTNGFTVLDAYFSPVSPGYFLVHFATGPTVLGYRAAAVFTSTVCPLKNLMSYLTNGLGPR